MLVEKVQDAALDGLPIGTVLIWRGAWARSPEDCWGRDRDPIPVLYHLGGRPAPPACAIDWVDVVTGFFLEECYWSIRAAMRLLDDGHLVNPIFERFLNEDDGADWWGREFEEDDGRTEMLWPDDELTVDEWLDELGRRLLEKQRARRERDASLPSGGGCRH